MSNPVCRYCLEPLVNIGIPGTELLVCLEGCDDLTTKMPVINPEELPHAKRTE